MKICPNCHEEVEDSFELCWNCNYSFPDDEVLPLQDDAPGVRAMECLRCQTPMEYSGQHKIVRGTITNMLDLLESRLALDMYVCPNCGKVEFFKPLHIL